MSHYAELGVSAGKEAVKAVMNSLKDERVNAEPGAFCQALPLPRRFWQRPRYEVVSADGPGNKPITALLAAHEKLHIAPMLLRQLAPTVIAMNAGDLGCIGLGAERMVIGNQIDRSPDIVTDEMLGHIITGYFETVKNMNAHGTNFVVGGGETADVGMSAKLAMAGFMRGEIDAAKFINCNRIKPGDFIVGISSAGKASWEEREISGLAGNGNTAAINDLLSPYYADKYPWALDMMRDRKKFFRGMYRLEDRLPVTGQTIAEALVSPARIWTPLLIRIFEKIDRRKISGIIHLTGGAFTKCLEFGAPVDGSGLTYHFFDLLPEPNIFGIIRQAGFMSQREMCQVFNLGQNLLYFTSDPVVVERIMRASGECSLDSKVIGRVKPRGRPGNEVVVDHEWGHHVFNNDKKLAT